MTRETNICKGFEESGIFPFNPSRVILKIPTIQEENTRHFDVSLEFLQRNRRSQPIKTGQNSKFNSSLMLKNPENLSRLCITAINVYLQPLVANHSNKFTLITISITFFFDRLIDDIILPELERYAMQNGRPFSFTSAEAKAFLRMNYVMGYHVLPTFRSY